VRYNGIIFRFNLRAAMFSSLKSGLHRNFFPQSLLLWTVLLLMALGSGGCSSKKSLDRGYAKPTQYFQLSDSAQTQEMVIYAFGLIGTGYKFGGRNPDAGLDCSGMVGYIVEQVSGKKLPHNAAQIANITRPIGKSDLRPGDLVFFNTMNRRYSHMGIYVGDGKFVHAPSSRGQIRVEEMSSPYFKKRFDGARTLVKRG